MTVHVECNTSHELITKERDKRIRLKKKILREKVLTMSKLPVRFLSSIINYEREKKRIINDVLLIHKHIIKADERFIWYTCGLGLPYVHRQHMCTASCAWVRPTGVRGDKKGVSPYTC